MSRASGGMADALASGASVLRDVGVQVPLRAQRAVHESHRPEVTNSKGFVTSGFSLSGVGVVWELTAGESRGEVPCVGVCVAGPWCEFDGWSGWGLYFDGWSGWGLFGVGGEQVVDCCVKCGGEGVQVDVHRWPPGEVGVLVCSTDPGSPPYGDRGGTPQITPWNQSSRHVTSLIAVNGSLSGRPLCGVAGVYRRSLR